MNAKDIVWSCPVKKQGQVCWCECLFWVSKEILQSNHKVKNVKMLNTKNEKMDLKGEKDNN